MTPIRTLRPLAKVVLSTQSDERLVALSREGSEDAFAEIVRRHRPGLLRLARSLGTGDRADDVVQDGLVRAWRALQSSDAEIDLRPWLTTIVRNRALTSHSTNRIHEELDETIDGVRQPGDIVIMREELRSAVSAVNSLPDTQREALVRSALSGESHDQIASALATTPGAVRQLIFRARTGLREAVGAIVPFPLVRALADIGSTGASAAASGTAVGGAAVAATAGGAGLGLKAIVLVAVGATVAGSGIAIERHTDGAEAKQTTAAATTAAAKDVGETVDSQTTVATPGERATGTASGSSESKDVVSMEAKSTSASRSESLTVGTVEADAPRVPDADTTSSGGDDGGSDADHGQTSPQATAPPSQNQPHHQGSTGAQTGQEPDQNEPPHDGDGHHQQPPPPPPPPPPENETAAAPDDGDGRHDGPSGGEQPQPADAHDDDGFGAGDLVGLTLGG